MRHTSQQGLRPLDRFERHPERTVIKYWLVALGISIVFWAILITVSLLLLTQFGVI